MHRCKESAWMNMSKELLTKPKHKNSAYQRWKQGRAIWRNTTEIMSEQRGDILKVSILVKSLDINPNNSFIGKLMEYRLNKCTARCIEH